MIQENLCAKQKQTHSQNQTGEGDGEGHIKSMRLTDRNLYT